MQIYKKHSVVLFGSSVRSTGSEDEDDEVFSNHDKDIGDESVMEWARVSWFVFINIYRLIRSLWLCCNCYFFWHSNFMVAGKQKWFTTDSLWLSCSASSPTWKWISISTPWTFTGYCVQKTPSFSSWLKWKFFRCKIAGSVRRFRGMVLLLSLLFGFDI